MFVEWMHIIWAFTYLKQQGDWCSNMEYRRTGSKFWFLHFRDVKLGKLFNLSNSVSLSGKR